MLDRIRAPGEDDPDRRPDTHHDSLAVAGHAWRLVGASRRGTSHVASGADREDAFAIHLSAEPGQPAWFCIAVADGVGSARFARVGAPRAVAAVIETIRARVSAAPAPGELRTLLSLAAWEAKLALSREALRREVPRKELGTTLLAVLGVESTSGSLELGVFQAGNGLIACTSESEPLRVLIDPHDEVEDGAIYDLTSDHVQDTWDESRFRHLQLAPTPWALVLLTDGVSDDLLPLAERAPALLAALHGLPDGATASDRLLDEIGYVKRGSGDDRTLVCALLGSRAATPPFVLVPPAADAPAPAAGAAPLMEADPPALEPPAPSAEPPAVSEPSPITASPPEGAS